MRKTLFILLLLSLPFALNTATLTKDEICKAACCNLAGSFETSAAVDVAYADAATGAQQIRQYIPAAWMDAIQVSKGTSSVRNGYESVTGQINVEYLKPQTTSPLAISAVLFKDLKAEVDVTGGWKVSDICHTALLVHAQNMSQEMDHNQDGFLDMPRNSHLNVLNRKRPGSSMLRRNSMVMGVCRIASSIPVMVSTLSAMGISWVIKSPVPHISTPHPPAMMPARCGDQ